MSKGINKEYFVSVPFAGYYTVEVMAESEEEAKEIAMKSAPSFPAQFEAGVEGYMGEWEVFEYLVKGNMCAAPLWEIEVSDNE